MSYLTASGWEKNALKCSRMELWCIFGASFWTQLRPKCLIEVHLGLKICGEQGSRTLDPLLAKQVL